MASKGRSAREIREEVEASHRYYSTRTRRKWIKRIVSLVVIVAITSGATAVYFLYTELVTEAAIEVYNLAPENVRSEIESVLDR